MWPFVWVGAHLTAAGTWEWTEPVNTPISYSIEWGPDDPNEDGQLGPLCMAIMAYLHVGFVDHHCSSLTIGF